VLRLIKQRKSFIASLAVATLASVPAASAQTSVGVANRALSRVRPEGPKLVRARRAPSIIVVDGRIDDVAWQAAELATDFVQQRPTPGAAATLQTEARVMFDAQALYVSMRLLDPRLDSLLAPLGRRDFDGYGDWAHVIIDSYHDRKTGFHFAVNPAGTRRDGMISNDAEWQEDVSWDAVWQVATSRDSLGWAAELRIPLTQLRFERCRGGPADSVVLARAGTADSPGFASGCVWGIQFMRDIGRRSERSSWAPIAPDAGGYVSRFGALSGVAGLRAPRRVEIVPYSVGQLTRSPLDRATVFARRTEWVGTLGADVGLGVTSKLTLTATINPDFGQVEADPSEVNLTGFETFLRERRPFFVEGSDIFQYQLGDWAFGPEHLFYSRRIGRSPQVSDPGEASTVDRPSATTILGAAKLSGKVGSWTLGMLDAVTGAEHGRYTTDRGLRGSFVAEPMTNYAVVRLFRDGEDGRNSLGATMTAVHRDLDANTAKELRSGAIAGGLNARVRSRNRDYSVSANVLGSIVRGSPEAIAETQRSSVHLLQRPDRDDAGIDTTRTSLAGMSAEIRATKQGGGHWRWGANGRVVSSGFEVNDLGFQLRSDVVSTSGWVGYVHFQPGRVVRRWDLWLNSWARWTLDGQRDRLTANVFANVQLQNDWTVATEVRRELSQMSTALLRGGPATFVPPNVWWWARVASDPKRLVSGELMTQGYVDDEGGGRRVSVFPTVTVRPSSRAELSVQPNITRVRNPAQYVETAAAGGDTSYVTGALAQMTTSLTARLNLTFTPTLSLQLYAQPFVSAGQYRSLGEVRDARARRLAERVSAFGAGSISRVDGGGLRIDRGAGRTALTLDDPDFTVRELASNAVLRWEYRPGSALFLVWAQSRDDELANADFSLGRQARGLWRTEGTNVLLIKVSYRIAP
jgi:Domain of unknown function (DUF5916)/Carbohydrate family 9 binding domain-like